MSPALPLFETAPALPEGMRYQPELLSAEEERALVRRLAELPFKAFEFQGFLGKRRVVSFGWRYDFNLMKIERTDDMPDFLLPLRARAAAFAGLAPEALQQVLLTEYAPGAGIGWHRDRSVFGEVVGISLLAPCVFRLRRKRDGAKTAAKQAAGAGAAKARAGTAAEGSGSAGSGKARAAWERLSLTLAPRSAYLLAGPARSEWEHSIPAVESLRYSVTFRNLRER